MAETMKDLKALIEAEKQRIEDPSKDSVPVVLGGSMITIEVTKLHPTAWTELAARHPARSNVAGDGRLGYNQATLPEDYPVARIRVDGRIVDKDTWVAMYAVLDVAHKNSLNTLMWGLNVYAAVLELAALGKAQAGRSSDSPANRGSRRADSKAASRRK